MLEQKFYQADHSHPIKDQKKRHSIHTYREQILYCLENYQILILVGESGSEKIIRIPQLLYEHGWQSKGKIGTTEPSSEADLTLANVFTTQQDNSIGDSIIKHMTEEVLLSEMLADPLLKMYGVIIIDKTHQRKLATDVIFGLLKKIMKLRKSLKLCIYATMHDANFFKKFFKYKTNEESSIVLSVEGAVQPVKIYYIKDMCANYIEQTVQVVWLIHKNESAGNILAFLPHRNEVLQALNLINNSYLVNPKNENLIATSFDETLSNSGQHIFALSKDKRKVVFTANASNTVFSIPGIVYVIDCGFRNLKWFNAKTLCEKSVVVPITKADAEQRALQAGNFLSGKVYRLYTKEQYASLPDEFPADMCRRDLTTTILLLKSLGVRNILKFDFPSADTIPAKNFISSLETLFALEAIDAKGCLSKQIGLATAEMLLNPMLSKMLVVSDKMECSEEIITIIAMLQIDTVFVKPSSFQSQSKCRVAKRYFEAAEGDLFTMLNVYNAFQGNHHSKDFCSYAFLNYNNLKKAVIMRNALASFAVDKLGLRLRSCNGNSETIQKCILSGFFMNAAYFHYTGTYRDIKSGSELFIHPDSAIDQAAQQPFLVYCQLVHTTKPLMKNITAIKEEWLTEVIPSYYHKKTIKNF